MISNGNNGDYRGDSDEYPTKHPDTARRMEATAARLGWDIPDEYKSAIVKRQVQIAVDPASTQREATSAARCLTSMNGQNVAIAISPNIQESTDKIEPVPVDQLLNMRQATAPGRG